ncbi:MAG: vanadium-dependent haloperoxidase [Chloroflexi bacterium]|nr:vanadium-dependent haloperoxidase [Chloroflexota bacterium]
MAASLAVALAAAGTIAVRQATAPVRCPPPTDHPQWSVARRWDEALLDAIRRALPAPTVHARNLFHTSAAMWDAWAAYDPTATGYFVNEKHTAADVEAARDESISYAAYRVLTNRFIKWIGADESLSEFDNVMDSLCYPLDNTTTSGDSPAAVGNRIAAAVIAYGLSDGSNQADGYVDPTYAPVNPPLVVAQTGTSMSDPNRWQPLQLEHMISQNGIPVVNGVQQFVGSHWGGVRAFALPSGGAERLPLDPGPPPHYGDSAYAQEALAVVRDSAALDTTDASTQDISPGSLGNNTLGTNDGHGRPVNPFTNQPYAPDVVNRGDFARSLAEFWADGPNSETPPGHWNVIANTVSDQLGTNLKLAGTGAAVDRLQWDVKLYFALNAAVHDAAIAAWGAKGHYDSVRPISMIRYLGEQGQLPTEPGLVQVDATGQDMIRAWHPGAGVGWIAAADWVPYQADTFVTPSFAGYFSGHSTFSRAAAEVLAGFTGSEYFPGGLGEYVVRAGTLKFEQGPSTDISLRWATYYDAADQAGISRLYGGIHIPIDDFTGRLVGSECGKAAWTLAQRYFSGLL